MASVRAGSPLNVPIKSSESVLIVDVTPGLDASRPAVNLDLGFTPSSDNYIVHEGALEPRPMLSLHTQTPHVLGNTVITGMYELITVDGSRNQIASGQSNHAVYGQATSQNGWSTLSYVSADGLSDPPSLAAYQYWDYAQVYSAVDDENLLYMAAGSQQTMYAHISGTTLFSSMTAAPRAKFVAALDNYVLAFNIQGTAGALVQRAQWTDRGSASSWTGGLSGFEDLLSMRGAGTRVVTQDNAFLLFSDEEVWKGVSGNNVFPWQFAPYDQSRGCPYSWTIASTPLGTMFLGKDYQVYLLPKGGGPSVPIGQRLQRSIRSDIDYPERAWAVFDNTYGQYKLYYPKRGGSTFPQKAAFLDVEGGSWMPQSFDSTGGAISLTRGCEGQLSSSATTWGGAQASGLTWGGYRALGFTWADMNGRVTGRAILAGSSKGTIYYENSDGTNDNGTAVPCRWQSPALLGDDPSQQKTVRELRVDYQSNSASAMTVQFSADVGASFISSGISLPATSRMSQSIAYPYYGARYPLFEVTNEGVRHRLFRFQMTYTRGGR